MLINSVNSEHARPCLQPLPPGDDDAVNSGDDHGQVGQGVPELCYVPANLEQHFLSFLSAPAKLIIDSTPTS